MRVHPSNEDHATLSNSIMILSREPNIALQDVIFEFIHEYQPCLSELKHLNECLKILASSKNETGCTQLRTILTQSKQNNWLCFAKKNTVGDELKNLKDVLLIKAMGEFHFVPGENTKKTMAVTALDFHQCMIVNKTTGLRCCKKSKYKLTSKMGKDIVYFTCGQCSQSKSSAWWKSDYIREAK